MRKAGGGGRGVARCSVYLCTSPNEVTLQAKGTTQGLFQPDIYGVCPAARNEGITVWVSGRKLPMSANIDEARGSWREIAGRLDKHLNEMQNPAVFTKICHAAYSH